MLLNPEETEKYFWSLPKEEREKALYTNIPSLNPEDLVAYGFNLKEQSIEMVN